MSVNVPNRRSVLLLSLAAFGVVFVLWQVADNTSPILYPFRLLVTFVHESGHGLAALITGGRFVKFEVFANGAGVATTAGGSRAVILSMGYLGAALFGAVLFFSANRVARVRRVALFAGLFFIACALLFTGAGGPTLLGGAGIALALWLASGWLGKRSADTARTLQLAALGVLILMLVLVGSNVALLTGVIAGIVFLLLSRVGSVSLTLFALNATALIVGFNAISDIVVLWNNQELGMGGTPNDALALARLTNLPTQLWLLIWIGAALGMMGAAAYFALIAPNRRH